MHYYYYRFQVCQSFALSGSHKLVSADIGFVIRELCAPSKKKMNCVGEHKSVLSKEEVSRSVAMKALFYFKYVSTFPKVV